MAKFKWLLTETFKPTAAVERCRFIGDDGDQIDTLGAKARAITTDSLDATDITNEYGVNGVVLGLAELELGGAIAAARGTKLTSDTVGRGVTAGSGHVVNAIAWDDIPAAPAAGDIITVLVVQEGETLA